MAKTIQEHADRYTDAVTRAMKDAARANGLLAEGSPVVPPTISQIAALSRATAIEPAEWFPLWSALA